ncbi:MAG TPA: thiamine phosphate synthase [Candidatus Limnocylindrales bacterium]|nr:thiamine phosphate synthase [Candidatus Limnocylindrales bacterium]
MPSPRPLPSPPLMLVTGDAGDSQEIVARCLAAAAGGVRWIQLRARQSDGRSLPAHALYDAAARLVKESSLTVTVNDRLDVALATGAAGLHLPGGGFHPAVVRRRLSAACLLGQSMHSVEEVEKAPGELDYVQLGPIFDTPSKRPYGAPLGTGTLERAAAVLRSRAQRPALVAIGGIRAHDIQTVAAAGADAIAVIGAIWDAADVTAAAQELTAALWRCSIALRRSS